MSKEKNRQQDLTTLMSCIHKARRDGFKDDFRIENRKLVTPAGTRYEPHEVSVTNFYRFEGASDPADSAILYLVTTKIGEKGSLADAYGVYADTEISNFLKLVQHIEKKAHPRRPWNIPKELPYLTAILILFLFLLGFVISPRDIVFAPVLTTSAVMLAVVYTFWIIVEIVTSKQLSSSQRNFWITLSIMLPFLGAVIYQVSRSKKNNAVVKT